MPKLMGINRHAFRIWHDMQYLNVATELDKNIRKKASYKTKDQTEYLCKKKLDKINILKIYCKLFL